MSHWGVSTERALGMGWFGQVAGTEEDHQCWGEILNRVDHIHARIGTEQKPQIVSPTPQQRRFHNDQWVRVWKHRLENHASLISATPEYGPYPYLDEGATMADANEYLWDVIEDEKQGLVELWDTQVKE